MPNKLMLPMFRSGNVDWKEFWSHAAREDWGAHTGLAYRMLLLLFILWTSKIRQPMRVSSMTSLPSVRSHPVQGFNDEQKSRAYGVTVHGDEGSGKHGRSVLVLSWSPLGKTGDPMFCKFPFADTRLRST